MAIVTLQSVISERFISGLTSSSTNNSSPSQLLSGQNSSQDTIRTSLRSGAKIYAESISVLNGLSSTLQLSRDALEQLGDITERASDLAQQAGSASASTQSRDRKNQAFQALGNEFREIIESADLTEDVNYLDSDGLQYLFTGIGLDPETASGAAEVFANFVLSGSGTTAGERDTKLASEKIEGDRPVHYPAGIGSVQAEVENIFDEPSGLSTRAGAIRIAEDLEALSSQIESNLSALDAAQDFLTENIDLVRATGLAMLDIAEGVGDIGDAQKVAQELQRKIRQRAHGSLDQAENLDPIRAATLLRAAD